MGPVYQVIFKKYMVDEFYFGCIINPLVRLSEKVWYHIDVNLIDKTTYFVSDVVKGGGSVVRSLQTGNLQQYAMYFALGLVLALSFILMR